MTPQQIFEEQIATRIADPATGATAREIDAIYQFHITGDGEGDWVVDLRAGAVKAGTADDADCTITIEGEDFVNLVKGEVMGPQLFMMNRLQIAGDMGLAMKLQDVLGA
jgi:putative sterol carrier protein